MYFGTSYNQAVEIARIATEQARVKAQAAKITAEKEQAEADTNNQAVITANETLNIQQSIYTSINEKITAKLDEYNNALLYLNSLVNSDDEAAKAEAQATVNRLLEELERLRNEAAQEYNILLRAQQDVQTAMRRAEIENNESEESLGALKAAEEELENTEAELQETEEAAEAAKLALTNEVEQLTEEDALAQGYNIIKTPDDLKAMVNNLSGKYILMNDIDLSGIEWEPIGCMDPSAENPFEKAFSGIFNGNGFSIKNLTIKDDGTSNSIGLFGATDGAEIKNLIVENINVSAPSEYNETAVGGLIGISKDTNIDNITVTGSVSGHQAVGGLIGKEMDSQEFNKVSISNVNTNVDIDAAFYSGGLIGYVSNTYQNSLIIENCHTSGNINITDSSAGGLIGEAGKTVITVNNCSSSMNITKTGEDDPDLAWLSEGSSKIGGVIGNCNGTYISICSSDFTGTLNCDDKFKGEYYGWYMNDAQVSIFELPEGLPVDDILKIDGIGAITPVIDENSNTAKYDITVSTLAGMNRVVDMIQDNPELSDFVTFNVQFDFERMNYSYQTFGYAQYGVTQHIYEDLSGIKHNDTYIDNEIDCSTTFNRDIAFWEPEPIDEENPKETMINGLYKDNAGKYYIYTGDKGGKYEGFKEVSLEFFFENQKTIVKNRLDKDEANLRSRIDQIVYGYQDQLQGILRQRYGWDTDRPLPNVTEPEYKSLKKKQMAGEALTTEQELKIALFELNHVIDDIVSESTKNKGCGMDGNNENEGFVLEDEFGRERWITEDGIELRQRIDENGEPMFDENGNPLFENLEGEPFEGNPSDVYKVRGHALTNEDGNILYKDEEGKTIIETKAEDGTVTYTYEDGSVFEGNPEDLTKQIEEYSPKDMLDNLKTDFDELLDLYKEGGSVDPSKENNGIPQKENIEDVEEVIEEVVEDILEEEVEEKLNE